MSDTTAMIDGATAVRSGEEIDAATLGAYLRETVGTTGEVEILQFPSGHSNLTYMIRVDGRNLVLRRPPFGAEKIKKGHDMGREYKILTGIRRVWDKVPSTLLYCDNLDVIGAPFYIMERVEGVILRSPKPKDMDGHPVTGLTPDVMAQIADALVDTLVEIHTLPVAAMELDGIGRPEGYVERQVKGWIGRYQRAKTDEIGTLEEVAGWLDANRPTESGATLVHNDYKHDNVILDPNDLSRVIGVLDWELSTIGDPMMDLGTTLAYWIQSGDHPGLLALPHGPCSLPGNPTRLQLAQRYAEKTGQSLDHLLFYYVFALFKIAGIGQQIYFRYSQGDTKDPRFAMFIHAVRALGDTAAKTLERGSI